MINAEFTRQLGIQVPIICGPMYPCSNPELVASVSEAGGIGIVQPVSLTYVHGYDFKQGLAHIRSLTTKPIGMNVLIEKSAKRYHEKMLEWVDLSLEEGVRFFITSLGNPDWVVAKVHAMGGIVYHDATERKWALKALDAGVDGLIAVNDRAGGHAGGEAALALYNEFKDLGVPLICAGGIGSPEAFKNALDMGYAGVQMGTRFIATEECNSPEPYKQAIVDATEDDIVLTECISGTPVSVIDTPYIKRLGLKAGFFARLMLRHSKMKYLMRMMYFLRSLRQLKLAVHDKSGSRDYWQAGKSVQGINAIKPATEIVRSFAGFVTHDQ